jgi:hypothetical protein
MAEVEQPVEVEIEEHPCAWCERTLSSAVGGFIETDYDDEGAWYCSTDCFIASL